MNFFKKFNIQPIPSIFSQLSAIEKEIIKSWVLEKISMYKDGSCSFNEISFLSIKNNDLKNRLPRKIDTWTNNGDIQLSILFNCLSELSKEEKITTDYLFKQGTQLGKRSITKAKYKLTKQILRDIKIDELLKN